MAKAPRNGPYICGIDAALDVVSGKWKGLILWGSKPMAYAASPNSVAACRV